MRSSIMPTLSLANQVRYGQIKVRFGGKNVSPPEHRFWKRVNMQGPAHPVLGSKCWLWLGRRNKDGYGKFRPARGAAPGLAHRYSWLLHCGEIPDGLCVLYRCDNPGCVRPDHLFTGTQQDNVVDMMAKGRRAISKGGRHARLTEEQVLAIRKEYWSIPNKRSNGRDLARKYGISQGYITNIVARRVWKHI
jgi:hypothetical protein